MSSLKSIITFSILLVAFVSAVYSSQQVDSDFVARPVSRWVRDGMTPLNRQKRVPWDWSLDALKCSLKILSLQVSNYHDNQMMCCGLWWIKSYLIEAANTHCKDSANHSIAVFNDMIDEKLIYSDFAKSLIGDQTADCAAFPEGSPVCDRFFATIQMIAIFAVLTLLAIVIGFIISLIYCIRWRRAYLIELGKRGVKGDSNYTKANSMSDVSNVSNNNNTKPRPVNRLINMIGNPFSANKKFPAGRAEFNKDALLKHADPNLLAPNGRVTPASTADGRSSSASTNSSNVPEPNEKV